MIEDVKITSNDCRGIYFYQTGLKLSGTSVINGNHAQQSDGGAILFDCGIRNSAYCSTTMHKSSFVTFDTQSLTTLSIINNTAAGYGGGIAIRRYCNYEHCFFRTEATDKIRITMTHNLATKGGDHIYGGYHYRESCKLWDIFDITDRNTLSAVSFPPNKVCICSEDFPQKHTCSDSMQLDTYPGQRFKVPLVCVGNYNYSSPCKVQANLEKTSIADIADETILQNIAKECK